MSTYDDRHMAYRAGRSAASEMKLRSTCPHSEGPLKVAWLEGWDLWTEGHRRAQADAERDWQEAKP